MRNETSLKDAAELIRTLAGERIVVVPSTRSGLTPLGGGPRKPAATATSTPKPAPSLDPAKEAAIVRAVTAALKPSPSVDWQLQVADSIVNALAARRSAPEVVNNVVDDGGAHLTNAQLDRFAGLFHDAVRMARGENIELSTSEAVRQAQDRVIRTAPTSHAERIAIAKRISGEAAKLKPIGTR